MNSILNTGVGNKIVLKGFSVEPLVEVDDGAVTITAGDPCDPGTTVVERSGTVEEAESPQGAEEKGSLEDELVLLTSGAAGMKHSVALSVPLVVGRVFDASPALSLFTALALTSAFSATGVAAQDTSSCGLLPIEVDIFVDTADADDIVAMETQTGQYGTCPPESTYWEHDEEVFGGYKGCVGEKALYPCPNDASSIGDIYNQTPVIWDGEECVETGFTMENRTFVIAGGNPYDTYELIQRTGVCLPAQKTKRAFAFCNALQQ